MTEPQTYASTRGNARQRRNYRRNQITQTAPRLWKIVTLARIIATFSDSFCPIILFTICRDVSWTKRLSTVGKSFGLSRSSNRDVVSFSLVRSMAKPRIPWTFKHWPSNRQGDRRKSSSRRFLLPCGTRKPGLAYRDKAWQVRPKAVRSVRNSFGQAPVATRLICANTRFCGWSSRRLDSCHFPCGHQGSPEAESALRPRGSGTGPHSALPYDHAEVDSSNAPFRVDENLRQRSPFRLGRAAVGESA